MCHWCRAVLCILAPLQHRQRLAPHPLLASGGQAGGCHPSSRPQPGSDHLHDLVDPVDVERDADEEGGLVGAGADTGRGDHPLQHPAVGGQAGQGPSVISLWGQKNTVTPILGGGPEPPWPRSPRRRPRRSAAGRCTARSPSGAHAAPPGTRRGPARAAGPRSARGCRPCLQGASPRGGSGGWHGRGRA